MIGVRLRIALYVVWFCGVLLLSDLALRYVLNEILPKLETISAYREKPGLHAKLAYYRAHASSFDLLFVGDSRTYTDVDPERLDARLGTRSLNLAASGNWFPTQYPNLQDLLPHVPEGTVIVWSIGHQNFQKVHDAIELTYSIGVGNVYRYLKWGFSWRSIHENVLDGVPGFKLYTRRYQLRERLDRILARSFGPTGSTIAAVSADAVDGEGLTRVHAEKGSADAAAASPVVDVEEALKSYADDPSVVHVQRYYDNGELTSVALYKRRGNCVRVELRPDFFREKQADMAAKLRPLSADRFVPDPEYWNNFLGIVDSFAARHVRLIVNEFEEAPYQYEIPKNRKIYRDFMISVRSFFEERGIPYVRVDFDRLTNDDYFDYNHMNSRGIDRFTPMFVDQLRPVLAAMRQRDGVQ
jgi:hypothetical protein